MKLLLVSQQLKSVTTGLGTYARGMAHGLVARGHRVSLATASSQVEEHPGLRTLAMDFEPWNITPFTWRRMAREYRRVLSREAADHDLVHFLDARESAFLTAPLPVPALGTVHDSYAHDWSRYRETGRTLSDRITGGLYYRWLRRVERRAYEKLGLLVANSDHVAATLDPRKTEVVRIGLPPLPPVLPAVLEGDPAVLFVGSNYRRKGLPVLLLALAEVREALPGLRLHVVGSDRRATRFERRAEELAIRDRLIFHGWKENEEVRAMMAGADLFAMPSTVEAFGLVYLEAMREGTPTVATAEGGISELFSDRVQLFLVRPGDAKGLAEILTTVAGDPALAGRIAESGRAAAEELTIERTVEETEALYERSV